MNISIKQLLLAITIIPFYTIIILASESPPSSEVPSSFESDSSRNTPAIIITPDESQQKTYVFTPDTPTVIQPYSIYLKPKPKPKQKQKIKPKLIYMDKYNVRSVIEK